MGKSLSLPFYVGNFPTLLFGYVWVLGYVGSNPWSLLEVRALNRSPGLTSSRIDCMAPSSTLLWHKALRLFSLQSDRSPKEPSGRWLYCICLMDIYIYDYACVCYFHAVDKLCRQRSPVNMFIRIRGFQQNGGKKNKKDKNDIRGDALFPVFWIIVDR